MALQLEILDVEPLGQNNNFYYKYLKHRFDSDLFRPAQTR